MFRIALYTLCGASLYAFGASLYTSPGELDTFGAPWNPDIKRPPPADSGGVGTEMSNDSTLSSHDCTSHFILSEADRRGEGDVQTCGLGLRRRRQKIAPAIRASARRLQITADGQEEMSSDGGSAEQSDTGQESGEQLTDHDNPGRSGHPRCRSARSRVFTRSLYCRSKAGWSSLTCLSACLIQ